MKKKEEKEYRSKPDLDAVNINVPGPAHPADGADDKTCNLLPEPFSESIYANEPKLLVVLEFFENHLLETAESNGLGFGSATRAKKPIA